MLGLSPKRAISRPAIKAVAEWFPPEERAFATGIFNSGSNLAPVVGPPVFVALDHAFGWRTCFLLTASLGAVVAAAVVGVLPHSGAGRSGRKGRQRVSYTEALKHKQTWGFARGKFLTDSVWWFYLFWLPLYLHDLRHMDDKAYARALSFIYFMACFGSLGGGWFSGFLMGGAGRRERLARRRC